MHKSYKQSVDFFIGRVDYIILLVMQLKGLSLTNLYGGQSKVEMKIVVHWSFPSFSFLVLLELRWGCLSLQCRFFFLLFLVVFRLHVLLRVRLLLLVVRRLLRPPALRIRRPYFLLRRATVRSGQPRSACHRIQIWKLDWLTFFCPKP